MARPVAARRTVTPWWPVGARWLIAAWRPVSAWRRPITARCALRRPSFRRLALGAGLDHRQRHPPAILVHRHHPDRDHSADRNDFVRALDIAIGHLTYMD